MPFGIGGNGTEAVPYNFVVTRQPGRPQGSPLRGDFDALPFGRWGVGIFRTNCVEICILFLLNSIPHKKLVFYILLC